jgi:tol-pal system protein YbgF
MVSLSSKSLSGLILLALLATPLVSQAEEEYPPPGGGMPPANTDLQMRMNALETQLRNMTGQLERTQHQNLQLQQTLQRLNSDLDTRFQMLEKRMGSSPPPSAAAVPPPAPATFGGSPPPASSAPPRLDEETDAPVSQSSSSGSHVLGTISSEGPKAGDPQTMYDAAFLSLRQARYDEAESRLKSFLKANPKHRLAENAKYWLGETYYVRGKFQEAAVSFGEGFQQFPSGSKAPDSLLKLAMSLGSINKKQDACTTLGELKKRFPNASAIIRNRAEQEKKSLACST